MWYATCRGFEWISAGQLDGTGWTDWIGLVISKVKLLLKKIISNDNWFEKKQSTNYQKLLNIRFRTKFLMKIFQSYKLNFTIILLHIPISTSYFRLIKNPCYIIFNVIFQLIFLIRENHLHRQSQQNDFLSHS